MWVGVCVREGDREILHVGMNGSVCAVLVLFLKINKQDCARI